MEQREHTQHPGLKVRRLIEDTNLTVTDAADKLNVSRQQLTRLMHCQSGISPEMALRLEAVFGLSAKDYLEFQLLFELEHARRESAPELLELKKYDGTLKSRNKERVIRILREHQADIENQGIENLYLFGSVACDAAIPTSDIDLCYDLKAGEMLGLEVVALQSRLSEILSADVDFVRRDALKDNVRANAEKHMIQVF